MSVNYKTVGGNGRKMNSGLEGKSLPNKQKVTGLKKLIHKMMNPNWMEKVNGSKYK